MSTADVETNIRSPLTRDQLGSDIPVLGYSPRVRGRLLERAGVGWRRSSSAGGYTLRCVSGGRLSGCP